jgi:hypothetical protein
MSSINIAVARHTTASVPRRAERERAVDISVLSAGLVGAVSTIAQTAWGGIGEIAGHLAGRSVGG